MSDYIEIKKECLLTWLDKQNIQCDCGTTNLYEELLDYTDEIAKNRYQQGRAEAIEELLSKCEQYNYTCNSREFAKVIREQLKEQK